MKKLLILLLLMSAGINLYGQNNHYKKANKGEVIEDVVKDKNYYLNNYDKFNKLANNWQLGAAGCAVASVASFIGYATLDEKFHYDIDVDGNIISKDMRTCARNYLIAGGVLAGWGIICQIISSDYRLRASKSLKVYLTGSGAGLVFNF